MRQHIRIETDVDRLLGCILSWPAAVADQPIALVKIGAGEPFFCQF
jgi:hypothetical protein